MAAPFPKACTEKRKLLKQFVKAVSDQHRIQSAQVAAVLNGQGFMFQSELAEANERKDQLKYAILAHLQEHGC